MEIRSISGGQHNKRHYGMTRTRISNRADAGHDHPRVLNEGGFNLNGGALLGHSNEDLLVFGE